jgi:hypothetical protein
MRASFQRGQMVAVGVQQAPQVLLLSGLALGVLTGALLCLGLQARFLGGSLCSPLSSLCSDLGSLSPRSPPRPSLMALAWALASITAAAAASRHGVGAVQRLERLGRQLAVEQADALPVHLACCRPPPEEHDGAGCQLAGHQARRDDLCTITSAPTAAAAMRLLKPRMACSEGSLVAVVGIVLSF